MSINVSSGVVRNAQVAPGSSSRLLVDDADAWRIILQCAEGQLPFIQLPDTLSTRFGMRFNNQDWSPLFTKLFRAWEVEDKIPSGPIDIVNAVMRARGVSLSNRTSQPTVPADASTHSRRIKRRKVASGVQVSRAEVEDEVPHKNLKTMTTADAQVAAQDRLRRPSRYSQAIHNIAQWYGRSSAELDEGKSNADEDEDEDLAILNTAGIWEKICEWVTNEISYETLLRHIDFQYEKYADIQYWEDFVMAIAIKSSVEDTRVYFPNIHHRSSHAQHHPLPSRLSSPAPMSPPLASLKMWSVKIHPVSSAPFIIKSWNQADLVAMALHKLLPGYVTVYVADPRTFLCALPKSHPACVKTWILVLLENQRNLFSGAEPSVPGWYTISKRGLYKGNIGYALSCDGDAGSMELLVAFDIDQDQRARHLFLPDLHAGTSQPPLRGRASVNPVFLTASLHRYNQLFWKEGDRVTVCDATHQGQRGILQAISFKTQSATVHLLEGGECFVPFSKLRHCFSAGDVVRIIDDPHSDIQNVHHRVIGKFANIVSVDVDTEEVTVLDSVGEEENHQMSSRLAIPHMCGLGSMPVHRELLNLYNVPPAWLNVVATWNPSNMFTLPITHFAHDSAVCDRDDANWHRGKEILVIHGEYRGWRGILRHRKKDTCTVELGAATLASLPLDVIVVRQVSHYVLGCDTTLAGTPLTPQESFDVDNVFERDHITEGARTKTPPPTDSPPPDAEDSPMVDENDVADGRLVSNFNFLMHPNVVDSLKIYHTIFKITGGWQASYLDRHVKTKVPSPFQLPSGQPTPPNTLVVILTE
ncbi:hypothetical protein BDN67DRAFT_983386 [Paxillus ammoniavirescens]|nr:hypothetical protein BDN67DRAFT_983386 [Paxillus ammoniavirescens]